VAPVAAEAERHGIQIRSTDCPLYYSTSSGISTGASCGATSRISTTSQTCLAGLVSSSDAKNSGNAEFQTHTHQDSAHTNLTVNQQKRCSCYSIVRAYPPCSLGISVLCCFPLSSSSSPSPSSPSPSSRSRRQILDPASSALVHRDALSPFYFRAIVLANRQISGRPLSTLPKHRLSHPGCRLSCPSR
jgi:hypothetical protein